MTKTALLRIFLGTLFIFYPFLIYIGLQEFQPRVLACFLLIAIILRFMTTMHENNDRNSGGMTLIWIAAAILIVIITFLSDSKFSLFLYPLLVNLAFFTFFALSLFYPPTVIERIARRSRPALSEKAIIYTRKVTQVWCIFFLLNGGMSLISIFHSEIWWMLYNGFISYVLIGLMLVGEYLIRLRVMNHSND